MMEPTHPADSNNAAEEGATTLVVESFGADLSDDDDNEPEKGAVVESFGADLSDDDFEDE
jgi:hypothetical protein